MREIGGYFELELNHGKEYHCDAISLNLGRTAFEYMLKAKKVQKVFLPYYTCEVMLEPITRLGINCEFYNIDERLEPVFNYSLLNDSDYFLYTNYFGVKDNFIKRLAKRISNLIIDNSQAFYTKPLSGVDTFYSPRKFFGIPDGGYLYTSQILNEDFDIDYSLNRFGHLIGRIEEGAEKYYPVFKENDRKFSLQPIKRMSNITKRLLQNINYTEVAQKRERNFEFLYEKLAVKNLMNFDLNSDSVPMVYPFLTNNLIIAKRLIEKKIFIATYWDEVKNHVSERSLEYKLVTGLIPIPIDQRYDHEVMQLIVKSVLQYA